MAPSLGRPRFDPCNARPSLELWHPNLDFIDWFEGLKSCRIDGLPSVINRSNFLNWRWLISHVGVTFISHPKRIIRYPTIVNGQPKIIVPQNILDEMVSSKTYYIEHSRKQNWHWLWLFVRQIDLIEEFQLQTHQIPNSPCTIARNPVLCST